MVNGHHPPFFPPSDSSLTALVLVGGGDLLENPRNFVQCWMAGLLFCPTSPQCQPHIHVPELCNASFANEIIFELQVVLFCRIRLQFCVQLLHFRFYQHTCSVVTVVLSAHARIALKTLFRVVSPVGMACLSLLGMIERIWDKIRGQEIKLCRWSGYNDS